MGNLLMILIGLVIGYIFIGKYISGIASDVLGSVQGVAGDVGQGG